MKKSWKPASSASGNARPRTGPHHIRGRISGPVPVPSPLEEEFPLRNPGPNITTPIRAEFKDSQSESLLSGRDHQSMTLPPAPSPLNEMSPLSNDNLRTTQRVMSPVAEMRSSTIPRTNSSNANRRSIVTPDSNQMKDNRPHRKQSKLRGAIGKLLGRRRKQNSYDSPNNTDSDTGPLSTSRPADYRSADSKASHQSETDPRPTNRTDARARSRPFPGAESKRSASLPITEFDRALRSHSIRPEDVRAIESARNSLSADFGRRQTASLILEQDDITGLSPRPASSQGRDSRAAQHEGDPAEIGRAITSDYMGYRRRSRSLSGLPEVEEDQTKSRRRSDEIRYWRESYDPAFTSPVSSNVPDIDDGGAVEDAETAQNMDHELPQPLPQPFQLDNFANAREIGQMKITHAASLESRVSSLESRVRRLEHALNQVCNAVPGLRPPLDPPDRPAPPVPVEETNTGYDSKFPSRLSMGQTDFSHFSKAHRRDISVLSLDDSLDEPLSNSLPVPRPSDRPTSITTIRGVSSLPTLSREASGPFTMDHYATLLALVHTERSAREALEAQVKRLGYQVSILAKTNAMRSGSHYDPPPTAKSFGDRSAFDHDDDDEGDMTMMIDPRMRPVDPEDSGIGTVHGDESVYSETFETPREEGYNFGAFGEDLGEENQQKKSARTLSLSQITRKNQPVSQSLPHAF